VAAVSEVDAETSWTCARCQVTASWMPGCEAGCPADWREVDGKLYCLACRRAEAGDLGVATGTEEGGAAGRARLRRVAVVEFEVKRDPSRTNGAIARACRTSVPAVVRARERLGMPAPAR
jgi:hypothetical protein